MVDENLEVLFVENLHSIISMIWNESNDKYKLTENDWA
jgi:hypothetical protein